jgi:hypothetical protein
MDKSSPGDRFKIPEKMHESDHSFSPVDRQQGAVDQFHGGGEASIRIATPFSPPSGPARPGGCFKGFLPKANS